MRRTTFIAAILALLVAVSAVAAFVTLNLKAPASSPSPTTYTYTVVHTYPHDTGAFTEGLLYADGILYESTGGYGTSTLRQVNLQRGEVTKEAMLSADFYGEGLALVNDSLVQLTWKNNVAFIYNKENFASQGNFSYPTEGWGLTYDGTKLIMSDGTPTLTFLDPAAYQKTGEISVHDGTTPLTNINELEYINGTIYANIWQTEKIAIINPQNGSVEGWIDMSGLYQPKGADDVLNGIACDQAGGRLFVTGKNWPVLYEVTIAPKV